MFLTLLNFVVILWKQCLFLLIYLHTILWKIEDNNDSMSIINDVNHIPMLFSYPVMEGMYFYEVELVTGGEVQIGWTTRLATFKEDGIQQNKYAIVMRSNITIVGDVIGCLVNMQQKSVTFYYNGKETNVPVNEQFFNFTPIFATVYLSKRQQITFNFDKKAFKYPPNKDYETLHSVSSKTEQSFQMMKPYQIQYINNKNNYFYLFDYSQFNLETPLFFCDTIQKENDNKWIEMEEKLNDDDYLEKTDGNSLLGTLDTEESCRFFQSVIEVIGHKLNDDKIAEFANFITAEYVCNNVHELRTVFLHYLNILNCNQLNSDIDNLKIRNLCIIMTHGFWPLHNSNKMLVDKSLVFLSSAIIYSTDNWTQLYAFIALERNIDYNLKFVLNKKLFKLLRVWATKFRKNNELEDININDVPKFADQLQLFLCAHNLINKLTLFYQPQTSQLSSLSSDKALFFQLNPNDKNESIKLSPSNLMARNDEYDCPTIRSKFTINPGIFYFEVVILTAGEMIIGLAAKQMDIRHVVGSNELSIGIDGYGKSVKMNRIAYGFKTLVPRWKVGDVIGIYFDSFNRSVIFGINAKIIELKDNPFERDFIFSSLPCHIAVSLHKYQQCYFNFNCKVIPSSFLNESRKINQKVNICNSVVFYGQYAQTGNIEINGIVIKYLKIC